MTIMGEAPTVDGSEIPNNHLGCIKNPYKKMGIFLPWLNWWTPDFWLPSTVWVVSKRRSIWKKPRRWINSESWRNVNAWRRKLPRFPRKIFGFKFWWWFFGCLKYTHQSGNDMELIDVLEFGVISHWELILENGIGFSLLPTSLPGFQDRSARSASKTITRASLALHFVKADDA